MFLKRGCAAAERDPNFVTISEHNLAKFQLYDARELEAAIVAWLARKPAMTKHEIDLRERCLGFPAGRRRNLGLRHRKKEADHRHGPE